VQRVYNRGRSHNRIVGSTWSTRIPTNHEGALVHGALAHNLKLNSIGLKPKASRPVTHL